MFKYFICLITPLIFLTSCGDDRIDQTENIEKKGYFVVGLDDHFPPMGFRNEKNKIVGFDIDLAKAVGKDMGLKVHFKPIEWDSIILNLNKNNIDVIWNGLTITESRKEKMDFSPAYLDNHQIIIVPISSRIRKISDFQNKVIGIQRGSTSEKAVMRNHEFEDQLKECRKFDNNRQAIEAMLANEVDAVVVDEIFGRYYMTEHAGQFIVLDQKLGSELYAVGMRKGDVIFQKMLNDSLKKVINSEVGDKISKKWFNKNILKKQ